MELKYKQKIDLVIYKQCKQCLDKVLLANHDFINLIDDKTLLETVNTKIKTLRQKYNSLAVVGMGGSSMGARMIIRSNFHEVDKKVFFFDDFDDYTFDKKLSLTDDKTHWVFISKSGETLEVLTMLQFINQHLSKRGIKLSEHCTVITAKEPNSINKWALNENVNTLYISSNLSGRFSVLSVVGMLPCAFSGVQVTKIHGDAKLGLSNQDLILRLACQIIQSFKRNEWITMFWIYSDFLLDFGYWLSQLWSESLAKATTRNNKQAPRVSTPMVLMGARDNHSILQQIIDGYSDKFIWFIRSSDIEHGCKLDKTLFGDSWKDLELSDLTKLQYEATIRACDKHNYLELKVGSIGYIVAVMEVVVAVLGEFLDINFRTQPGVDKFKLLVKNKM